MSCEVCYSQQELTRHHVVPKKAGGANHPSNEVVLCMPCHALVERYYWSEMSRRFPRVASDIKQLAIAFMQKAIPEHLVEPAKARQRQLWDEILAPRYDWKRIYANACEWIHTVEAIRPMHVRNAITAKPWWRTKKALKR